MPENIPTFPVSAIAGAGVVRLEDAVSIAVVVIPTEQFYCFVLVVIFSDFDASTLPEFIIINVVIIPYS